LLKLSTNWALALLV